MPNDVQRNKMDMKPRWFELSHDLIWPMVDMGLEILYDIKRSTLDLQAIPYLALLHHGGCLQASMLANEHGKHAAAVCLVRQSVEALTVVDIGLQPSKFAEPLLCGWKEGKKSHGQLRQALEKEIWPRYGKGLWEEPWSTFYANLAQAVQPYAHYSPELQGWQFMMLEYKGAKNSIFATGMNTFDDLKATRITLFHTILTWVLGRLLMAHGGTEKIKSIITRVNDLGQAIASSSLLFKRDDWGWQLVPHMIFKPGYDWRIY
jgi:hypothetical protein